MKNVLILLCFLLSMQIAFPQNRSIDSILQKIAVEKDEDKKADLIISIWNTGSMNAQKICRKAGGGSFGPTNKAMQKFLTSNL
ncbi:MAG: hypothetical protein WKF88_08600 [Ferruginibacter sp.]